MQDPGRLRHVSTFESTSRHCGTLYRVGAMARAIGRTRSVSSYCRALAVCTIQSENAPAAVAPNPQTGASLASGTKPCIHSMTASQMFIGFVLSLMSTVASAHNLPAAQSSSIEYGLPSLARTV